MYYKYPRTFHLPFSPGTTSDDKIMRDTSCLEGKIVSISEKLDGENANFYSDKIHARSIDSRDHESRNWVKQLWGSIKHEIPDGWRICGENCFAKHSIFYDDLSTYFYVYGIYDQNNICLSLQETVALCEILKLTMVPSLGTIQFDENLIKAFANNFDTEKHEGFVLRNIEAFHYDKHASNTAKWVRKKHVQTSEHWMFEKIIPNKLKS